MATTLAADTPVLESVVFPVRGMTCSSCVNRITRSLRKVDGVTKVRVDLARETATVTRAHGRASDGMLAAAVSDAGYEADLSAVTVAPAAAPTGLLSRLLRR
jgi:copper chaperone CopZ